MSKNKCLYTCESKIDCNEYMKMVTYFPRIYWSYVIRGTVSNLVLSLIITIIYRSFISTLVVFIFCQLWIMIDSKVRLKILAGKTFNSSLKKGRVDTEIHTEFYDDYFVRQGETVTLKIKYSDVAKSIETDTNFYLYFRKKNVVIIIQKNSCDLELIHFLREKLENLENHLGDSTKFKGAKEYHNPKFIKKIMLVLFVITVLSLYIGILLVQFANRFNPIHFADGFKNFWVLWFILPIPILSIVLGFKFKHEAFGGKRNIVAGFIVFFLLLFGGALSFDTSFIPDYNKIDLYRDIIDAQIPDNGYLEILNYGSYVEKGRINYSIIYAYYEKEDVSSLLYSIERSDNWILSNDVKSELLMFIPSPLILDDDAYYSIYNKTTHEYNTLPESFGIYEIYAMKYDKSDKRLEIHKYVYSYEQKDN